MKFRSVLIVLTLMLVAAGCSSDDASVQRLDAESETDAESSSSSASSSAPDDSSSSSASSSSPSDDEAAADDAATADDEAADDDGAAADDAATDDDAAAVDAVDGPQRIVSLNPTGTEMLFAIGAGDQVIAVDEFSYYPPEAPVVEGLSGFTPSVEAIAEFEPDLVVTAGPIEGLDALGVDTVQIDAAVTFDDVYAQIEQLGVATGHVADAAEVVLQMQTDIDAVLATLPERETPLTYFHELDNTLYSVTSATFVGHVYEQLGLVNVADAADPDGEFFGYPQLNEEFLFEVDPDLIFLADTLCCDQSAATVAERAGWDQLRAVQAGNVIELNDDVASRWGPRLVEFVQVVGEAVAAVETAPAG